MTCLEAQSNIMAFIDKKLPEEKAVDFVRHVRRCGNCSEELEIYYTLIVGIRQVDNNEELSQNFKEELNTELLRIEHKAKKAKRFKISTFGVAFAAAVMLMFFGYSRILTKVYNIEQLMIRQNQGEHYFYDCFGGEIEMCGEDIVADSKPVSKSGELTFYERIRIYNDENPKEEEDTSEDMGEVTVYE